MRQTEKAILEGLASDEGSDSEAANESAPPRKRKRVDKPHIEVDKENVGGKSKAGRKSRKPLKEVQVRQVESVPVVKNSRHGCGPICVWIL